jgi:hypothetical protein
MFLNEVRNHAFGDWNAGTPLSYVTQLTNAAELQLQHSFLRQHPARLTIPSEAIGARGPFVYEVPNSYRVTLAAAAAIGDWALWPSPEIVGNEFDVTHVGPFFVIPGTNDRIEHDVGGLPFTAEIADGWYNALTLAAEIDAEILASSGLATVTTFDGINRLFTITHAGVLNIDWGISTAAGMLGYTANDTGALAYQSDVPAPGNMKYRAYEGKQYQMSVVAHGSVPGNLLRVRVIGLDTDYAIAAYLNANGVWQAAAAQRTFQLSSQWRSFGVNFEAPPGIRYFLWQVSNGTAGAQVIDLGRFWWQNPTWQMGGEEARV